MCATQSKGPESDGGLFDQKERFRMVKQEADRLLRQRQEELRARFMRAEELQRQKREELERKQRLRKEQEALKERAKEENVQRHQRRLAYKKELFLQRLSAEKLTFDAARRLKHEVIQERYYNHMVDEIKRRQLKAAVEQMQYSKRFGKRPIEKIVSDFGFMGEQTPDLLASHSTMNPRLVRSSQSSQERSVQIDGGRRLHKALKVIQQSSQALGTAKKQGFYLTEPAATL